MCQNLSKLESARPDFVRSLAMLMVLLTVSVMPAAADDATNPLAEGEPVNPLLEDDEPFVGVFQAENMTVHVRQGKEGALEGTVKKGERVFPLTAKREGETLKGYFSHNGNNFTFTATLEGKTLLFTSADRLFKLTRDAKAVASVPAPTPPVDPVDPAPGPPAPTFVPGNDPKSLIPKGAKAEAGKAWAGFPNGTYVMMEEVVTNPGQLPVTSRAVYVFRGLEVGKEMIQPHEFNGKSWAPIGQPVAWLGKGQSPQELGFVAGQSAADAIEMKGVPIACIVTPYSREEKGQGGKILTSQLKVWTAKGYAFPSQPMILPEGVLRVEGDIVRITRTGDDGTELDFQLAATNVPYRLGRHDIVVSTFKGIGSSMTPQGKLQVTLERSLSPQVPGGMAAMKVDTTIGEKVYRTRGGAVEIGMTKIEDPSR
ncbi:MAG: hypothetical protein WD768_02410 [Phycisphaeraceae bacterium]